MFEAQSFWITGILATRPRSEVKPPMLAYRKVGEEGEGGGGEGEGIELSSMGGLGAVFASSRWGIGSLPGDSNGSPGSGNDWSMGVVDVFVACLG